ncbi:MAG: lactate racemization operon protein LarA, partial [Candidatus Bathyarchaeia archaeon]
KRLAKAVAGDVEKAHLEGARFIDRFVRVKAAKADVVVTSNSGYPLDRDLYQAVKGMATAEPLVKDGGFIIVASECRDGIAHPKFEGIVAGTKTPEELLEKIRAPGFSEVDQWEAHIMARVQSKAHVIMVTRGISSRDLARMHLSYANSIEEALAQARTTLGRRPEITVIPEGPYTIVEPQAGL